MDHSNRAHRMTDAELAEWNREPFRFIKGLLVAAAISLLLWGAVVLFWCAY